MAFQLIAETASLTDYVCNKDTKFEFFESKSKYGTHIYLDKDFNRLFVTDDYSVQLQEQLKDQFNANYYSLPGKFGYKVIKPLIDALKIQYKDFKVFYELEKVYSGESDLKNRIYNQFRLFIFKNENKNTLCISLRAY